MKSKKIIEDEKNEQILDQILKYAAGELDYRGTISEKGDTFDAITGGLNMLGEEIQSTIIELKAAKEKAEESDRLKSTFLNNISHEIRTPLSIIIGLIEVLKDSIKNDDESSYFLDTISSNALNLLKTFTDIIDISCIELKIEKINYSNIVLHTFISELISKFKAKQTYQLKSHIEIIHTPPNDQTFFIATDKLKLQRIINILIENALKFTIKGFIEISYKLSGEFLHFDIKDTGIGIQESQKQLIFDKFRQADENLTRQFEGVGLGLAISKALTELLGGKIYAESEPGKGSTFSFTIPYKPVLAESVKIDNFELKNISTYNIFSGKTILIIEDEIISFIILRKYLEPTNIEILHADDGLQAIEICKTNSKIDLILMDVQLHCIKESQIIKKIKKTRPNLPIISHTSDNLIASKNKTAECGYDDYIVKPTNKPELIKLLFKHLFYRKNPPIK